MSQGCRQSPLKALLNTLGTCHKTHTMTIRYGNNDAEDVPALQDLACLDLAPPDHTMPRQDSDSSNKYNEETDTHCHLAELLEQFQLLQDQFTSLKFAFHPPTPMAELIQLTDKLQHLTMMLQPNPTPSLMSKPCTKLCRHTLTHCMSQRQRQTSPWPYCRISLHSMDRAPQS